MTNHHMPSTTRRQFLAHTGMAAAACWYPSILRAVAASPLEAVDHQDEDADVLIVGGGLGGCWRLPSVALPSRSCDPEPGQ